ncbi:MAG: hypothetical protein PHX74_08480 [Candidatus Sumerlaeales bacterium]|nr:hypothetical protein [Candidatus Sumerlaeales bacterium]
MKITGIQAAIEAERAVTQNPPILYEHEDCQRFIKNTVLRAGGEIDEYAGSNDMFRNACSEIVPLATAKLVPGMVLFIVAHDGGEPAKYQADGLGNASHIGWYTGGMYKVVHSSATRGQVAASTLSNGWTHAGKLKAIHYGSNTTNPGVSEQPKTAQGYIKLPTTDNVFHRISPSKSSPWWGRINGGEAVEIVSDSGGWTRVRYGGHDGYVMSKFITTDASAQPDPIGGGTTPPTLPQVDLIAARLNALKTQINAIAGIVDELIGLIPKG